MKLLYLGPEQSFSHQAAKLSMQNTHTAIDYIPKVPLENVVSGLRADGGDADIAIIPYYNYLEGLVQESLDLIYENELYIVGSQRISIIFCLGGYERDGENTAIYSHPKALAQCTDYLCRQYPGVPHNAVASTTDGARIVAETRSGFAVASKAGLLQYRLPILKENIGNTKHGTQNFTDFFLLGKQETPQYTHNSKYLTMIAVTPHIDRVGLLQEILTQIAFYDLNLAKIHSRPAIDEVENIGVEPQMFYLEIVCHKENEDFKRCVAALEYRFAPKDRPLNAVRILGTYTSSS